jgi:uncharacterized protein (DUF433 family)
MYRPESTVSLVRLAWGCTLVSARGPRFLVENPASRITIKRVRRFGKPCVRDTRITLGDVLGWLATGMTFDEILFDFEQLLREDILACLAYATEREQHTTCTLAAA